MNSTVDERGRLGALLAALRDPPRAASLPDDAATVKLARQHRLTPLLSITCGDVLPAALRETFRRDRVVTAARNMLLGGAAETCLRALGTQGVPAIVLKGLDYESRLYGVVGARPTADVDLLVADIHRRKAFAVLDQLGFEPRAAAPGFDEDDYHEVAWTRAGVEIDLHMALAPIVRCQIDYAAVWKDAQAIRFGEADGLVLARPHAAIFQALHMAIDHFAVPAIYLVDLERLLELPGTRAEAERVARLWRCHRPLATALALLETFAGGGFDPAGLGGPAARVVASYGRSPTVSRPEQFLRKFWHFDTPGDALRYLAVQSRRNIREILERRLRRRSPRDRLHLATPTTGK